MQQPNGEWMKQGRCNIENKVDATPSDQPHNKSF